MEQLKPILDAIKTHRFWIVCGLTTVACLVTWILAALSISGEAKGFATEIGSGKNKVDAIKPTKIVADPAILDTAYPNPQISDEMKTLINTGRQAIAVAWEEQRSKQEHLFVWPRDLSPQARDKFHSYRPIESLPFPTPPEDEAEDQHLTAYRDYIAKRLPELAELIGARWINSEGGVSNNNPYGGSGEGSGSPYGGDGSSSGGRGGPGRGGPGSGGAGQGREEEAVAETPIVVDWDQKNQELWLDKTTVFMGKNNNQMLNNMPLTVQVLYAQEDLWILEAIFNVIKETNGEADASDLAKIKTIDHIFVGIDATGTVGNVGSATATRGGSSGRDGESPYGGGGNPYGGGGNPYGGAGGAKPSQPSDDPAHNRYVDKDYQALTGQQLRAAFTAPTADNAYLAVAKRVPVRIGVQMDERAIMEFLQNCANSQPTLEIRQFRINRHKAGDLGENAAPGAGGSSSSGRSGSGYGGDGEGPGSAGTGTGAPAGGAPSGGYGGDQEDAAGTANSDYTVALEIYGIVHIFNPVDPKRVESLDAQQNGATPGAPTTPVVPVTSNQPATNRNGLAG